MRTDVEARPCPRCGSTDAAPIVYGLPGVELQEAVQRGEVRLGGCVVMPEAPDFECRVCGAPLPWVAHRDADGSGVLQRVAEGRRMR